MELDSELQQLETEILATAAEAPCKVQRQRISTKELERLETELDVGTSATAPPAPPSESELRGCAAAAAADAKERERFEAQLSELLSEDGMVAEKGSLRDRVATRELEDAELEQPRGAQPAVPRVQGVAHAVDGSVQQVVGRPAIAASPATAASPAPTPRLNRPRNLVKYGF